jgi:hypothetical protein
MSEAEQRNEGVAVERSDVSPRLVGVLAGGVALLLLLSAIGIMILYPKTLYGPSDAPRLETAEPRLQIDPAADFAAYRAAETRELESYGWIDRAHGIVRIPIDRAMRDVAAAGIKDWPGAAP